MRGALFGCMAALLVAGACKAKRDRSETGEPAAGSGRVAAPATDDRGPERTVRPFVEIEISGGVDLTLTQKEPATVVLIGPADIVAKTMTFVVDKRLTISCEPDVPEQKCQRVEAQVRVPELRLLRSFGSGDIRATTPIAGVALGIGSKGRGAVTLEVKVEALEVAMEGRGQVTVAGWATDLSAHLDGAVTLQAKALKTLRSRLKLNGAGRVELSTEQSLNVQITGSGTVRYTGDPKVKQTITGSGTVERADDPAE